MLYDLTALDKKIPSKTVDVKAMIRAILLYNNSTCWGEMEQFTMGKKVNGSKGFDQHTAVLILLKHDRTSHEGQLTTQMLNTPALNETVLWRMLYNVLQEYFTTEKGYVIEPKAELLELLPDDLKESDEGETYTAMHSA